MRSWLVWNLNYQCMKPIIAANNQLSYGLSYKTIIRPQDDVMTLLCVGDGPGESAEQNKRGPRDPCTKYRRS
jgi:hypothetical protein